MEQERILMDNIFKYGMAGATTEVAEFIVSNTYLYLTKKNLIETYGEYDLKKIAIEINEHNSKESIKNYFEYLETLSLDEIRNIIYLVLSGKTRYSRFFNEYSNNKLSELTIKLLKVDGAGHIVFDMGSGTGNFLANVYKYSIDNGFILKDLFGVEFNATQAYLSNMAMQIIRCNEVHPFIKCANALEEIIYPYTLAYVFPPFGMKFSGTEKIVNSKYKDIKFSNRNTTEWIFIDKMLRGNPHRAIALTTTKVLYNDADKEYRNRIIKDGLLEGIIELPSGALEFTGIKTCILVFSEGNKSVKLVDASNVLDNTAKRFNRVELPVEKILSLYNNKNTETRTIDEAIEYNNLVPSNALIKVENPLNGVELASKAEVFTGSQYTVRNFEEMSSDKKTGYKILTSSDIEDGFVNWKELQNIDYKDTKFDKFAVQKNDVIVTSKSSKVKTVVVDIEPKEKILVTGGMIIVRPDIEKLDPTFLKIYLESKQGQLALKSIQKGTVIITLNSKDLSNILIPDIDIKKQREKAELYNNKLSTLLAYKKEIAKIENNLSNFYFDEFEEE